MGLIDTEPTYYNTPEEAACVAESLQVAEDQEEAEWRFEVFTQAKGYVVACHDKDTNSFLGYF